MHISSLSYSNKITVHQKHKETQKILTPYSKSKYCTIVDRFAVQTTKLNQNRDFLVHVCFFRILLSSTKNGVQWVFIFTASIKTKVFLPDRKKGNRNISTGTKFFLNAATTTAAAAAAALYTFNAVRFRYFVVFWFDLLSNVVFHCTSMLQPKQET